MMNKGGEQSGWAGSEIRFAILAGIAGAASATGGNARAPEEATAVAAGEGDFYREWTAFAHRHRDLLAGLQDLREHVARPGSTGSPVSDPTGGAIALDGTGHGLVFAVNGSFGQRRVTVPTPSGRLLRELYPHEGRLWDTTVAAERRQVHVLEVVDESSVRYPALIGAAGSARADGDVSSAVGEPGSVARVSARLGPSRAVNSIIVFDDDGLHTSVGPWYPDGSPFGIAVSDVAGDIGLRATWAPTPALRDRLDGWPRLKFLVELRNPEARVTAATVDGHQVPLTRAHWPTWGSAGSTGYALDLTEILAKAIAADDLQRRWQIMIALTAVEAGSFGGMHIAELPRLTTGSFVAVDVLDSEALEAVADTPPELPVILDARPAQLLRLHAERGEAAGSILERDICYGVGAGRPLRLSAYRRQDPGRRVPGVLFVHGGGWSAGDPFYHARHARFFAEHGFVTANVSYRLHPEARWPDSLEDVKCAVRWMRENAEWLGLDPTRIAVAGGSAGAHLAAMTALTPGRWDGAGGHQNQSSAVQAALLLYPALDLDRLYDSSPEFLRVVMADFFSDRRLEASPVSHLSMAAPPVLTILGTDDTLVGDQPANAFHAALSELGVANRLEWLDGGAHGFDLASASRWEWAAGLMLEFLHEHL